MAQPKDNSPTLDDKVIEQFQGIVGARLYVGRAVNNKLLLALSAIGSNQEAGSVETAEAIEQLMYYVATYPEDGIIF